MHLYVPILPLEAKYNSLQMIRHSPLFVHFSVQSIYHLSLSQSMVSNLSQWKSVVLWVKERWVTLLTIIYIESDLNSLKVCPGVCGAKCTQPGETVTQYHFKHCLTLDLDRSLSGNNPECYVKHWDFMCTAQLSHYNGGLVIEEPNPSVL